MGAAVALVLSVCLLLCVLHSIRHPLLHPTGDKQPPPEPPFAVSPFRYADPPTAIYTEQFVNKEDDRRQTQQRRSGNGAFTPLDDNLYPVQTEVDFTPRYLLDQELEDVAAAVYRADSPMPELTRLLQEEEDDEDEDEIAEVARRPREPAAIGRTPTNRRSSGGGALLVPNGRPGLSLRQQPDVVESTVSLPLLSPFYDPSLRSPSSSLLRGPASPTPSNSTWAPSLASTPEPRLLGGGGSVPRRRPPHGKPPPPPRTDSLSSRSTHRKRRPLSVPAPCHLSVRGQFDTFGAIENSKIRLLYLFFVKKYL